MVTSYGSLNVYTFLTHPVLHLEHIRMTSYYHCQAFITFITNKNYQTFVSSHESQATGSVKFDNDIMTSFLCIINVI